MRWSELHVLVCRKTQRIADPPTHLRMPALVSSVSADDERLVSVDGASPSSAESPSLLTGAELPTNRNIGGVVWQPPPVVIASMMCFVGGWLVMRSRVVAYLNCAERGRCKSGSELMCRHGGLMSTSGAKEYFMRSAGAWFFHSQPHHQTDRVTGSQGEWVHVWWVSVLSLRPTTTK